jgi:hypothetical protein
VTTSITKSVGVTFTGDIAPLADAMEDLVEDAQTTAKGIAEAFGGLGKEIDTEWSDLGEQLGETLSEQGDIAGKAGSDSIIKQYSDAAEGIDGELTDLEKLLAESLDKAGSAAGTSGVAALTSEFKDAGKEAAGELDDFDTEISKTLTEQSGVAGKAGAEALAEPFAAAGTEAGGDFTGALKTAAEGPADAIGAKAGEEFRTGFVEAADVASKIPFPGAGAEAAGTAAGEEFRTGFVSAVDVATEMPLPGVAGAAAAGETAGEQFRGGFEEIAEQAWPMNWPAGATAAGDTAGKEYSEGFKEWMDTDDIANWPIEGASAAGAAAGEEYGEAFDAASAPEEAEGGAIGGDAAAGGGLLAALMDPEALAPLVATVGSIWATINLQDYEHKIAAAEDISIKAASAIATSWGSTAGNSIYSENQMADAYAGVAGQFSEAEGHAATLTEATKLMAAAADLAESSGDDLTGSMSALVTIMQAFKVPADDANKAAATLYAVSEKAGQPIGTVVTQFQKLHSQLGDITPPLGELGGLFLDLINNGESGKSGIGAVQTAIHALLQPTVKLNDAQGDLKTAFDETNGPSRTLADSYASGKTSSEQYENAVEGLSGQQAALANNFQSAYDKVTASKQALAEQGTQVTDSHGKFVGLNTVIADLDKKMAHQTQTQQLATVQAAFGASASQKLLDVILDGPAAFEKYTKAASSVTDMQQAATKNTDTLGGSWKKLEGSAVDLGDKIGPALIPVLTEIFKIFAKVMIGVSDLVTYFEKHTGAAIAFGAALVIAFAPITGIPVLIAGVVAAATLLIDHWKTVETFFTNLGKSVWTALDTAWHNVENDAITTWNAINHFFSGIPDKIVGFFVKFSLPGLLAAHWSAIKSAAKVAWGDIEHVVEVVPQKLWDFFKTLPLVGELAAHWKTILTDAVGAWEAVNRFIMNIPGDIVRFFQKWTLVELINKAWTDIESGAKTAWDKTLSFLEGIPGKTLTAFESFGTLLIDIGKQLIAGLLTGIEDGVGGLLGHITGIGGQILSGFKSVLHVFSPSTDTQEIGQNLLEGLDLGVQDSGNKSSILSSLSVLANSMLTTLKGFVPQFETVGEQLMQGLAAGVAAAAGAVATAAAQAATSALTAAKTATKTASPSQAFADLGENLMQGLAQGITGAAGLARAATTAATGGLASANALSGNRGSASSVAPQINITVESPSGTLPASTLQQIGEVVTTALHDYGNAMVNAYRVSGA